MITAGFDLASQPSASPPIGSPSRRSRCARLQSLWRDRTGEPVDRAGRGRWVEVYPAAALAVWGLESRRYKTTDRLRSSVGDLRRQAPWLMLSAPDEALLEGSHDAFDALVCALTARAAALGATHPPSPEDDAPARREGWIHVPACDIARLAEPKE